MKKSILLALSTITLLSGCVSATYHNGPVKLTVTSVFRDVKIERLTVDKKTEKTYQGLGANAYDGSVNTEAIQAVVQAAVAGAVKGAK